MGDDQRRGALGESSRGGSQAHGGREDARHGGSVDGKLTAYTAYSDCFFAIK
jgi:hypothetical protein